MQKLTNLRDRRVLVAWVVMTVAAFLLAVPTVRDTGLDYDEALYGHLARDFLQARHCPQHMPGSSSVEIGGRPFPVFVQGYLGAIKCWLLLPSFVLFGSSISTMRFTMLAGGALAILFLMLWVRRIRGDAEAILVGLLTFSDPGFFFPTVCDWGAFVPSFLFRCLGLYLFALWWVRRRIGWIVLAGGAFGLGFFNKIDFVIFLFAAGAAAGLSQPQQAIQSFRREKWQWFAGALTFLFAGGLMVFSCFHWLRGLLAVPAGAAQGQLLTKLHVAAAVLDGSYFLRLMQAGGMFDRMFESSGGLFTPLALVLSIAVIVRISLAARKAQPEERKWTIFLLAGLVISTAGFFLCPDAVRIHHFLLVYPFPQLLMAAAATCVWRRASRAVAWERVARTIVIALVMLVVCNNLAAVRKTQRFVSTTGGRGTWSKALELFARDLGTRADLVVGSLDWGFHEQLSFLSNGPQLYELTWNIQQGVPVKLLRETNFLYLLHPPEFSLFDYGETYLAAARRADPALLVESRTNAEGRIVFQYFRFTTR